MNNIEKHPWPFHILSKAILIIILSLASCDLVEDALPDDDPTLPNITLLNGEWLMIDGNNDNAIGMKISVSNGSSTVLDPAATSFNAGVTNWKSINPIDKDLFEHQELGSDGNYYSATIKLINDDEIEINVEASGSGNFQRWIRVSADHEYVKLQGVWVIVNASGTNIIEVKGSAGRVVVSSGSSFSEGDIIWKNIESDGTSTFTFLILGSDGNYTSATITIISENEIEIIVGSGDPEKYGRFDGSLDLSKIQGAWTRVESNNPASDFMQVNVVDNQATVVDKAQSGFNVGDVKWKDISPTTEGKFTHKELGSDGQYYDATISMVNDSTLEIVVVSSGAGNAQKWVRNPPPRTVELDCKINSETTLTNGPAEVDYRVKTGCVVDITAPLIIEPGVVIEFEENAGLGIYDNGSIKAAGTSGNPIIFRGVNPVKGYWRGIHIETNSMNNRFEYVSVRDAGSNYVYCCNDIASVFIKDGLFAIENSTIENGGAKGLYVNNNAELSSFSNVTITTHDDYPLSLSMERAGELDGLNSDFSGNEEDFIEIHDRSVSNETTIEAANIPYLIDDVVDITEGLTILEGAELVMRENAGLGVYDNGYLNIQGAPNNYVTIRGFEAIQGYWRGIHMETSSVNNKILYAQISDAGSNYVYCCNNVATIFLKSGTATIGNSIIDNGASYGVATGINFEFSSFYGNSILGHKDYPMYIHAENVNSLDPTDSFSGNDKDFVAIYNSNIDDDIYWPWINVPYLIEKNTVIDITARVTIEPDTEIAFDENAGLGVYDGGILNAEGTDNSNIIFRGKSDVVGFWRGIHIETNSQDNILDHCQILNAGSNYVYCCNGKAAVFAKAGQLSLTNSVMSKSGGCGLLIKAGATVTESGNTFSENTDGNICN
jgi:hypothetical protein